MSFGTVENFHADLRAGLRQSMLTIVGLPAAAWEGWAYTPKVGTPYFSEAMVPLYGQVRGLGAGGYTEHGVDINYTLHYPTNGGTNSIDAMAAKILGLFLPGTPLNYGTVSAWVSRAEKAGNQQDADWISVTVSVTLIGHTTN